MSRVIASLISELRRRKVTQVILAYGAFSWLLLQVGGIVADTFEAPTWGMRLLFLMLLLGLPVTVILAWVFQVSPHGIERTATLTQLSPRKTGLPAMLVARISGTASQSDISPAQANLILRESALWALDFHSHSTEVHATELEVAFEDATEALLYAIRVQDHAQLLKIPLHIGISKHPDIHSTQPLQEAFTKPAYTLALAATAGSIAIESDIRTGLRKSRIKLLDKAIQPLNSEHATELAYGIDPALIKQLDDDLKVRAGAVSTTDPSTLIKALSLMFLTALVGMIWSWLPGLQRSAMTAAPTVAVLPFTDPGKSDQFALLVDGLSDDLFNAVARIDDIQIAARRSSRLFRDSDKSVEEIGTLLNAVLLLEGEIRPYAGRVKVTAWLTETSTGLERWNRSFEQPIGKLDQIRRQLAEQLANELDLTISPALFASQQAVSQVHPDVYPMYLEAMGFMQLPITKDSLTNAQSLFEQAIAIAPNYLAAKAGLCRTYLAWYRDFKDIHQFETAQAYCLSALDSGEDNIDLLIALGSLYRIQGDNDKAREFFDRGLMLSASNVQIQQGLARVFLAQGDKAQAERVLKQALQLDPAYAELYNQLGSLYIGMGRWDDAIDAFALGTRISPADFGMHSNLGSAYFYSGRFAEAASAYEKSLQLQPNRAALSNTATMHYYSGDYQRAVELYLQATALAEKDHRVWANLADAEILIPGQKSSAQQHYQLAYDLLIENLEVNQKDPELLAMAAWCAVNIGQTEVAEVRITEAILQESNSPVTLYYAALVHSVLEHEALARSFVSRALENGYPVDVMAATPRLAQLIKQE